MQLNGTTLKCQSCNYVLPMWWPGVSAADTASVVCRQPTTHEAEGAPFPLPPSHKVLQGIRRQCCRNILRQSRRTTKVQEQSQQEGKAKIAKQQILCLETDLQGTIVNAANGFGVGDETIWILYFASPAVSACCVCSMPAIPRRILAVQALLHPPLLCSFFCACSDAGRRGCGVDAS